MKRLFALTLALLLTSAAYAQVPDPVDPEDNETNTPNPASEDPQVSFEDGILLIVGTDRDDIIKLVSQRGDSRPVVVQVWDFTAKKLRTVAQHPKRDIRAIHVHLFDGNDQLLASNYGHLYKTDKFDMTVFTGAGAHTIHTGHGNDFIQMGADSAFNAIITGSGDDVVHGGNGHDKIMTEHGNDQLFGHGGNDLLSAGPKFDLDGTTINSDYIDGGDGFDFSYGGGNNTVENVEFVR